MILCKFFLTLTSVIEAYCFYRESPTKKARRRYTPPPPSFNADTALDEETQVVEYEEDGPDEQDAEDEHAVSNHGKGKGKASKVMSEDEAEEDE